MRDARSEAAAKLPGHDPRVLEPAPPADQGGPFWADDPVAGGDVVPVVRPGTKTWDEMCQGDEDLRTWCADRWLGAWRRLQPLPAAYVETRASMHALAEHVLAPARHAENGKIGLRYTHRGFGTPFFGADHQVRVEGQHLIVHDARAPITTLRAAARHAGVPPGVPTEVFTPTTTPTLDEVLAVDAPSAHALGEWYGFCASVLEQLREEATPQDSPARVQLWPEHFDLAVDLGNNDQGRRANYGGSPGDAEHPEPYLYVGPWSPSATDCYWNEPFGATLGYRQLLEADDQREAALAFLRHGKELLQTRPS